MRNFSKDILFLCQFFYPESNSSATIPFDTAKQLEASGITVDAMCGYPKEYNFGGKVPVKETVDGVDINRIKYIQLGRKRKLSRLINYFSFTFIFSFDSFCTYSIFSKINNPISAFNSSVFSITSSVGRIVIGLPNRTHKEPLSLE